MVNNLAVDAEHVQRRRLGVRPVEELLERQQHAGLQRPVVLREEQRVELIQLEAGVQLHLPGQQRDSTTQAAGLSQMRVIPLD